MAHHLYIIPLQEEVQGEDLPRQVLAAVPSGLLAPLVVTLQDRLPAHATVPLQPHALLEKVLYLLMRPA